MELDLRCLASFMAVVEDGHFGRAARNRHLTTSAISKQIARLETQVGQLILREDGGAWTLTEHGRFVAGQGRRILGLADTLRPVTPRSLILGMPGTAHDHVPPIAWRVLALFLAERRPDLHVKVVDVPFPLLSRAHQLGVDIIICVVDPETAGMSQEALFPVGRRAAVAATHPLAGCDRVSLAELESVPLVWGSDLSEQWMRPWLLTDCGRDQRAPRVEVRTSTTAHVLGAARTRDACTVIPAMWGRPVEGISQVRIDQIPDLMVRAEFSGGTQKAIDCGAVAEAVREMAALALTPTS